MVPLAAGDQGVKTSERAEDGEQKQANKGWYALDRHLGLFHGHMDVC